MNKFLFFSNNNEKIYEIKKIFKPSNLKLLTLNNLPKVEEPDEIGRNFIENAKIKSLFGYKKFGIPCFADDSGICISALNNKPGVFSKRFLNKFKNKKEAFKYILQKVIEKKDRKAFFKTSICLTLDQGQYIIFEGKIAGNISLKPKGVNGFGYDPLFVPEGYFKTFSEMNIIKKNKISHRSIAIKKLINFISR